MITARLIAGLDPRGRIFLAILAGLAILVPVLNLAVSPDSAFHVPTYAVSLLGKYLCYALLALALDLVWGYCGILSLGHGAFFALGGYAMGMYLMRQIGSRGVYGNPVLPDFMVFLNYKELPWFWTGFDHFWFAAIMVLAVPGLLAFVFGWFAFRSRVTGVYLSIITQAMTYALLLAFFRNDMGFGGNNGLTDFKDILGFNVQADATRSALFAASAVVLALAVLATWAIVSSKYGKLLTAVRDPEHRTEIRGRPGEKRQAVRPTFFGDSGGGSRAVRRPAVRPPGRLHQSRRIRAVQLDRDRHMGCRRRARHHRRTDHRRAAGQCGKIMVHRRAAGILAVCAGRPVRRRHPAVAQGHRRHVGFLARQCESTSDGIIGRGSGHRCRSRAAKNRSRRRENGG